MSVKGGARPGAGRPKGSLSVKAKERLAMQAEFIDFIRKNKKKIWEAHLKLALGVFVPVKHPFTGKIIDIAQKPPDGMALAWMQEQVFGRAPQTIEVAGEVDGNVTHEHTISPEMQAALDRALQYAIPESRRSPPSGSTSKAKG